MSGYTRVVFNDQKIDRIEEVAVQDKGSGDIRVRFVRELCGFEAGEEIHVDEQLLAVLEHDGYAVRVREDTAWDLIGEEG